MIVLTVITGVIIVRLFMLLLLVEVSFLDAPEDVSGIAVFGLSCHIQLSYETFNYIYSQRILHLLVRLGESTFNN